MTPGKAPPLSPADVAGMLEIVARVCGTHGYFDLRTRGRENARTQADSGAHDQSRPADHHAHRQKGEGRKRQRQAKLESRKSPVQQAFRFNERKDSDYGRFRKVLSSVVGKRVTYSELTEHGQAPS